MNMNDNNLSILNPKGACACSCADCKSMCRRPCWPLPREVKALIEAGHADRLMLDYWEGDFHDDEHDRVYIPCGANPGHERCTAPESISLLRTGCVFQSKNGLCELHTCGLKPIEGRLAHHDMDNSSDIHEAVARAWDTEEGRAIVTRWARCVGHRD